MQNIILDHSVLASDCSTERVFYKSINQNLNDGNKKLCVTADSLQKERNYNDTTLRAECLFHKTK